MRPPLAAIFILLLAGPAMAQGLAGTYTLSQGGTTLTLVLAQDPQGNLTGSLSSTTGASFRVEGQVQDGVGMGAMTAGQGGSYFEAHPQGVNLLLALIEPGPDGMPDYNQVRQLSFTRQGGGGFGAGQPQGGATQGLFGAAPQGQPQGGSGSSPPAPQGGFGSAPPASQGGFGSAPSGGAAGGGQGMGAPPQTTGPEISQPQWGFAFRAPAGWKHQFTEGGVILGHDSIPGLIIVSPHALSDAQALAGDIQQGLVQGNIQLQPAGQIRQSGQNMLAAEYQGVWEGSQARGICLGTLSPFGGGAYVLAVTTPQMYGQNQVQAAQAIAAAMRYFQPAQSPAGSPGGGQAGYGAYGQGQGANALVQQMSGRYWGYSGSTETKAALCPDGVYYDSTESSYSGQGYNSLGDQTMAWGTASQNRGQGRWTAEGTVQQGTITITYHSGDVSRVQYRAIDNAGCYKFNNTTLCRQGPANCQ